MEIYVINMYKVIQSSLGIHKGLLPGPSRISNSEDAQDLILNSVALTHRTYTHLPVYFKSLDYFSYLIKYKYYVNSCLRKVNSSFTF